MRKPILLGLLLLLTIRPLCAAPSLPILDAARVVEKTLPNGLGLVIKEERQWPVVALGMYIKAGSLYEYPADAGAAHLVEHLLFETNGDNEQKLAPFIESLGGRISATTLRDFVHVDIVISSRYLEQALPALLKAVFEGKFTEQQMMREVAVIKREITDRSDRVDLYLDEMIWQLAYQTHPYGRSIGGTAQTLSALTFDTLTAFRRRFYVPNNTTLVAAGDVDPVWLESRVKELTAGYPAREVGWQPPPPEPPLTEPRVKAQTLNRDVTLLAFAWHAPGIADKPDVCAMDLIFTVLGQGAIGRLNRDLVQDKKLILTSDVDFLTQKHPGLMVITALMPAGREIEAEAAILQQVKRLADEPLSEAELDRAKRLLYTEYAFSNESYDDQIGSMGFYAAIENYRFALEYIDQVMKVTPAELQQVVQKYLRSDNYALAILRGKKANQAPEEAAMLTW